MIERDSRERLLETAETLFHERGYSAVSMRDIAEAVDMRQASLYYHVPEGKEQLFVEVTERGLNRHRRGLCEAIDAAEANIQAQLEAAANWFIEHMPIRLLSMLEMDMPAISPENCQRLTLMAYDAFFGAINPAFKKAVERGELLPWDSERLTGLFLSMIDGISYATTARQTIDPPQVIAQDMITLMLDGARPR